MKNNNIPGFERENKKHHQDQHKRVLMQLKKIFKKFADLVKSSDTYRSLYFQRTNLNLNSNSLKRPKEPKGSYVSEQAAAFTTTMHNVQLN